MRIIDCAYVHARQKCEDKSFVMSPQVEWKSESQTFGTINNLTKDSKKQWKIPRNFK